MLQDAIKIIGVVAVSVGIATQLSERLAIRPQQAQPSQVQTIAGVQATSVAQFSAQGANPLPSGSQLDTVSIQLNQHGQYLSDVDVNGQTLPMVVDTGATYVSLRNEDAAALGVYPAPGDYKLVMKTANGLARAAAVKLQRVQIGRIEFYDIDAVVMAPGALSVNLLGMTFLSRLSHVEIAANELVLRK